MGRSQQVGWTFDMDYIDDSNRPNYSRFHVKFLGNSIQIRSHNYLVFSLHSKSIQLKKCDSSMRITNFKICIDASMNRHTKM